MNEWSSSSLTASSARVAVFGLLGLAACGMGAALTPRQFSISYLTGYTFWLGLSLGCLGVTMIHHLTGGRWGFVTRRFLEAGSHDAAIDGPAVCSPALQLARTVSLGEACRRAQPATPCAKGPSTRMPRCFAPARIAFFAVWLGMAFGLRRWSQCNRTRLRTPSPLCVCAP